ncbi:MAG: MaoC family dehydratase [Gemmatimonadetes bacterium]|nr:MaoC family dehydratase [Gemmatimonadota bacterium]
MRFSDLTIGQSAEITRTVTDRDIQGFADVTGDTNPLHLDEAAAKGTMFKGRIAHGMLGAGFISAVIGTQLPGFGSVYVTQSLAFRRPVRPGDTITTRVEVVELMPAERRVRLATTCRNHAGKAVIEGEAVILMPDELG